MAVATSSDDSTVGVRDLKNQLSAYLDRVKAGEEITVTEHGRPIARLTALAAEVDQMARLVEAGIIEPGPTAPRRLPRRTVKLSGTGDLADLVAEQRR